MQLPLCREKFQSKEIVTAKHFAKMFDRESVFEKINPVGAIMILHPGLIDTFVKPLKPKKFNAQIYPTVYVIKHK